MLHLKSLHSKFHIYNFPGRKFIKLSGIIKLISLPVLCFLVYNCYILWSHIGEVIVINNDTSRTSSNNGNPVNRLKKDFRIEKSSKILCYILLSRKKIAAAKKIQETWGSRCDKLVFYGRFTSSDLNITFLNVTEGYAYLWGKTKAALLHLDRVYSKDYDWFIKADDDTFLIFENLRAFVSNLASTEPLWFGYKLRDKKMKQGYMSGGAAYVFSKHGLHKIALLLQEQPAKVSANSCDIQGQKGYEDLELGKCCIVAGLKEVVSTDEKGRERFLPMPLSKLLNREISKFHWIWDQAWNPIPLGDKCCSPELISMHQVSPSQMKTLYYLIYEVNKNQKTAQ